MMALLEHFHEAVTTPEDVEKLKKLILQLAMQGKLVEQDSNDEPVTELLKRIEEEKKRLVKEKKIKKFEPLPPVSDGERKYVLPLGWEWVRLGDVSIINPRNQVEDETDVSFIPMKLIEDGFSNSHTYETKTWGEIKKGFTHFQEDDVVVAKITPCFENRKSVVMNGLVNGYGAGTTELHVVRLFKDTIVPEYVLWLFKTEDFISKGVGAYSGTAGQQRVSKDLVTLYTMPLPPIEMQRKIVKKIAEIFEQCDLLTSVLVKKQATSAVLNKSVFTRLQDHANVEQMKDFRFVIENMEHLCNDKESIDQLRNSILSLAVQGKLVEQDTNEEPASVLIEKIKQEKERLIAEKEIKKEKPLPPITSDEFPYELPQGWEWVRLGDVSTIKGGKRLPNGYGFSDTPTEHIYIRVSDMKNNTIDERDLKYISDEVFQKISQYIIERDDLYITIVGSTIGKVGIVPEKFHRMNLTENASRIIIHGGIDKNYLLYSLSSQFMQNQFVEKTNQLGQPKLALIRLKTALLPLPPLDTQIWISNTIQVFYDHNDALNELLVRNQKARKKLFNSLLSS